jgi:hypothetical protein
MGDGIVELQQSWVLYHLAFDMPDQIRGEEKGFQARRTALRDDVQHIAAVGLGGNPVHFDDDGAGDEVLAPEVHPCSMPRPAPGNETPESQRATQRWEDEASVITGDLETKEVHD